MLVLVFSYAYLIEMYMTETMLMLLSSYAKLIGMFINMTDWTISTFVL